MTHRDKTAVSSLFLGRSICHRRATALPEMSGIGCSARSAATAAA
jgi:hypothetical protein